MAFLLMAQTFLLHFLIVAECWKVEMAGELGSGSREC